MIVCYGEEISNQWILNMLAYTEPFTLTVNVYRSSIWFTKILIVKKNLMLNEILVAL